MVSSAGNVSTTVFLALPHQFGRPLSRELAILLENASMLQIQSDSRLSTAAVAIGVSLPVVLWFRARYGGYGGPLSAMQAFELLQETDAVFVDIR